MSPTREDPRAGLVGVLHDLAREISTDSDTAVEVGTMFRSPGLRAEGKILAFLGFDGELIVKLPRPRGQELLDAGAALSRHGGRRLRTIRGGFFLKTSRRHALSCGPEVSRRGLCW